MADPDGSTPATPHRPDQRPHRPTAVDLGQAGVPDAPPSEIELSTEPAGADGAAAATGESEAAGSRLAKLGLIAALVSRVFGRLVGIILVIFLAREASDETVAVYGYLLGTATLVLVLTDLGVAAIAGREVAAGRLPAGGALRSALPLQAFSVAAAALATVLLTVFFGPKGVPVSALLLTVAFVVVSGFNGLWAELLRATGRVMLEGALQMGGAVALVIGGLIVVYSGGSATALMVVVFAKELVVLVICIVLLPPRDEPSLAWKSLLGQSIWVAVAGTAMVVLWRQGTIVAGTGSTAVLAAYVVASRYLDAGVTVAHTVGFGLVPGMSALSNDPAALRRAAIRYLKLGTIAGLAVAVIGFVGAPWLVEVPFGARWEGAIPAVRYLAISALPILLSFVLWPVLLAQHRVKLLAGAGIAAVLVGLPTGLVLFKLWHDPAAPVVGTGVGAVVLLAVLLWGVKDLLRGNDTRQLSRQRPE
ncbi:oligosaccharide flippase family protein [Nakamurella aerolata]|uniref:Oligosaccharide flippase family protein n=1 Tax=Nakamurella aerolata TaxID=1656892 RepID=A0A849AE81_9ACTN|nr:oligosaccharide flippase family protein [Nakamurella aerolata]NNG35172.1 oligosaccharide flippase family protein [Nakamurella aerolata]